MKAYCYVCHREVQITWEERRLNTGRCPDCGGLLSRPPKARKPGASRRPRPISEASEAQRAKVFGQRCVACGKSGSRYRAIDPAHLAKRSHGGCDDADCVLPLCRTFDGGCHRAYDEGELDLLSAVISEKWPTYRREVQHMLEHLRPVQMIERLGNARTQWGGVA